MSQDDFSSLVGNPGLQFYLRTFQQAGRTEGEGLPEAVRRRGPLTPGF
jgi:hypothetical protein